MRNGQINLGGGKSIPSNPPFAPLMLHMLHLAVSHCTGREYRNPQVNLASPLESEGQRKVLSGFELTRQSDDHDMRSAGL